MQTVDLNCDMGESFGAYNIGHDEAIMEYVSSANIACGFHGGDPSVMRKTVDLAKRKNIAIGAHPGYPDLQGFGRREINLSADEVYDIVVYQIGALMAFARVSGTTLTHVKPHGALYNTAARDRIIAAAIARAVKDAGQNLGLMALSGSVMIEEGRIAGLRTASEVFADRAYLDNGSLAPRTLPQAMIVDPDEAAHRVLKMVKYKTVTTLSGKEIPVVADTVCIHGDSKHALSFAKSIHKHLIENNVSIKPF